MTEGQPLPWPPYVPLPQPYRRRVAHPLDWLAAGAAAVAFGCSFLAFYSTTVTLSGPPAGTTSAGPVVFRRTQRVNAWHGFFGWFAVVLALVAAALIILAIAQARLPTRVLALVAAGAAAVFILIAAAVTPSMPIDDQGRNALRQARGFGLDFRLTIDHERAVGYWLVLAAIVLALLLIMIRLQHNWSRIRVDHAPGPPPPG